MGILANLLVRIGAETADFDRGINRAVSRVKSFGAEMQNAGRTLTFGVTAPLAGIGIAALKAAGEMEQAEIAFTTMAKSADVARKHIEDLKRFTLQTPFVFADLARASRLMQAYGFQLDDVVPKLRIIGNAVSALGGGPDLLERVVRSIGEIGTRGKVTGEQLRELSRAGIPALDAIAKTLGVSVAEAQKKITAGQVDAKTAMESLLGYMETRFAGGMEAQSKGLIGMWSNVRDAITFTLADIGKQLAPLAKDLITNNLQPLLDSIRESAAAFGQWSPEAQKAALGAAAFAAALGPVIWITGSIITNAGVLIGTLNRLAGVFGVGRIALLGWVGALVAAATAMYEATAAGVKHDEAQLGMKRATDEHAAAVLRLSGHLRSVGMDTAALDAQYKAGKITLDKYQAGLTALAREHGKHVPVVAAVTEATQKQTAVTTALEEAAGKAGKTYLYFNTALFEHTVKLVEAHKATVAAQQATAKFWAEYENMELPPALERVVEVTKEQKEAIWDAISGIDQMKREADEAAKRQFPELGQAGKKAGKETKKALQEVSTVLTNMNQDIARAIVNWEGFGSTAMNILKRIGEAIIAEIIEKLILTQSRMTWIIDGIGTLLSKIPLIGSVFGGGASAATSVLTQIPGTPAIPAPSLPGAPAGAVSGAASGIMGTVGAIGSAVSAVTGVIGAFQNRAMNKSLDLIVSHTLGTANQLIQGIQPVLNKYLPELASIRECLWVPMLDYLRQINDNLTGAGGGGGGIEFNNCSFSGGMSQSDFNRMFNTALTQARAAGYAI